MQLVYHQLHDHVRQLPVCRLYALKTHNIISFTRQLSSGQKARRNERNASSARVTVAVQCTYSMQTASNRTAYKV